MVTSRAEVRTHCASRHWPGLAGLVLIAAACGALPDGATPAGALPPTAAGTSGPGAPGGDLATDPATMSPAGAPTLVESDVPPGSHPHDVAPAADGTVWYTAQGSGALGRLDPRTGETHHVPLGPGSSPHGVIIGPDGAPWVTDSGLNAIVRVDPSSEEVQRFSLPLGRIRRRRHPVVHRPERRLWAARSTEWRDPGLRCAGRPGPVRDHRHAEWRGLLRLAGRKPHRPDRPRHLPGDRDRASHAGAGRTPCVV